MKKLNFFSVLLLSGVIVMQPLVSCTPKDYDADIDNIRKEIADVKTSITTLDQAIKAGKLITNVAQVAGGWEITFSDNSKITVRNGANGANGKDGIDGTPGANGKDGFAPILSIDAQGYWTVITKSGGTPVRMKDANGQDVKAVASVPSIGENDNWFIDGIDTGKPARGEQGDKGDQGDQGEQGNQGDKGDQGIQGLTGKSPYIDATSKNWMVWNVQTNAYEDSKISAEVIANITVDAATGELMIDGKSTNRYVPSVMFDALNNKVFVTLKDDQGNPFKYEIALMKDVLLRNSIVSLTVQANTLIGVKHGIAIEIADPAIKAKRDAFIGKTTGAVLYNGVEAAFIVNPTNADLKDNVDKMSLITPKGEEPLSLLQKWVPFVWNNDFVNTKSDNATALWTANIVEPTIEQLNALSNTPVAVKVTTGSGASARSVVSNYGYRINAMNMGSFGSITNSISINDVNIGAETNATAIYRGITVPRNGQPNTGGINPFNYYKAELIFDDATPAYKTANDAVRSLVAINGMTFSTSMTNATALEDKVVYFKIKMVDYTGAYYELPSYHKFVFGLGVEALANVAQTLTLPGSLDAATKLYENQKLVDFSALFSELTPFGMSNQNLTTSVVFNGLPAGVSPAFVKSDASVAVPSIADADCKGLRLTIDAAVAVPGTYDIEMIASGRNVSGAGIVEAIQKVKLTIVNPSASTYSIAAKRTALFVGNMLTVYGDFSGAKGYAQIADPTIYTILGAYNGVTPVSNYELKATGMTAQDVVDYGNPFVGATTNGGKFNITGKNVAKYTYSVDVTTPLFGNLNNKVVVDQIKVIAQSEIAMGSLWQQSNKSIDLTNGQANTVELSKVFAAKDVYGKDLSLFLAAQNERVVATLVEVSGVNASLVTVAQNGNDWTISTVTGSARLESDVQIPLEITITDKLGAKKTLTTSFMLKKNI